MHRGRSLSSPTASCCLCESFLLLHNGDIYIADDIELLRSSLFFNISKEHITYEVYHNDQKSRVSYYFYSNIRPEGPIGVACHGSPEVPTPSHCEIFTNSMKKFWDWDIPDCCDLILESWRKLVLAVKSGERITRFKHDHMVWVTRSDWGCFLLCVVCGRRRAVLRRAVWS